MPVRTRLLCPAVVTLFPTGLEDSSGFHVELQLDRETLSNGTVTLQEGTEYCQSILQEVTGDQPIDGRGRRKQRPLESQCERRNSPQTSSVDTL